MWGLSVHFWELVFRGATISALILGGLGVTAAFVSAWVGYELTDIVQKDADKRIAEAAAMGEIARAEAEKAKAEAAGAQLALERERTERVKLEKKVFQDRRIEPEQRATLLSALKAGAKGPVLILPTLGPSDAVPFAEQIEEVLREAGFEIQQTKGSDPFAWTKSGVFVIVKTLRNIPLHALSVIAAFAAIEITVNIADDSGITGQYKGLVPRDDRSIAIAVSTRL